MDILLYPNNLATVVEALDAAAASGRITTQRAADALERYARALALTEEPLPTAPTAPAGDDSAAMADRLLDLSLAGGPALRSPIELVTIDDDLGGPYAASPSDWTARALTAAGVPRGRGGSRVLLVFSEPRAWKGRAGLGEASRKVLLDHHGADLVVLFAHPRITGQLPPNVPVLLAWHRQRLMQDAVARWISRRVTPAAARPG